MVGWAGGDEALKPALTVSTSPMSIRLFSIVWRVVSKRTPPTLSTMRSEEGAESVVMAPAIFGVLERRRLRSAGGRQRALYWQTYAKLTTISLSCELMVMREAVRGIVLPCHTLPTQRGAFSQLRSCVSHWRDAGVP